MTATELLALLGNFWWRLLLFPGGLAAFTLIVLAEAANRRLQTHPSQTPVDSPALNPGVQVLALACPWLALAWMPLPPFEPPGRQADLAAVLALFEIPRLLLIAAALRDPRVAIYTDGLRRLAALVCGAPALILAVLALAVPGGSLEIDALARIPDPGAVAPLPALHWIGAAGLSLLLPALLELGPFACGPFAHPLLRLGIGLRRLGLLLTAALPWAGLAAGKEGLSNAPWLLLVAAPAILGIALLAARLCRKIPFRQMVGGLLGMGGVLLIAHAAATGAALAGR